MRRKRLAVGALVGVATLVLGGGAIYIESLARNPIDESDSAPRVFEVPKGSSVQRVGRLLRDTGFIGNALVWRFYVRLHPGADIKAGKHELRRSMNVPELLATLRSNPLSEDIPVAMVEGWRLVDADAWLASSGLIEAGAYLAAASAPARFAMPFEMKQTTLEGYLLPETYAVPPGKLDVDRLIQRQIDAFNERFVVPHAEEIRLSQRTLHQIVVMASMLEREEPKPAIRPHVAGILYKRLDALTPLGVDATTRYTLTDWSDRHAFLRMLRDPADVYNTRLRTGLPPTAIGAPGIESLQAALRPQPSVYWYYLHDRDQNIHCAETSDGHEANRRKYDVY